MNKQELLEAIGRDRAPLDALVATLSKAQLAAAVGDWSVKDHLSHIAAWERMIVAHLHDRTDHHVAAMDEAAFAKATLDDLNDRLYRLSHHRSVPDTLLEFAEAHKAIVSFVEEMPAQRLAENYWDDDPAARLVLDKISGDTFLHYREHAEWIGEIVGRSGHRAVKKTELLANILRDRAQLDALVASVGDRGMTDPALEGGRSVKDVLAHITAWERLCVSKIRKGSVPAAPATDAESGGFTEADMHRFNESVFEANRARPLATVVEDSRASYTAIVEMVTSTDADLDAPPAWAASGAPLGEIISEDTDAHYREHIDQITRWLKPAKP